jgi:hypothetical protein
MSTTTKRPRTNVLGRYSTPAGERTLYARRKQGITYVTDEPASRKTHGALYAVEQIPVSDGDAALDALAADYLEQARVTGQVPMELTRFSIELKAAA